MTTGDRHEQGDESLVCVVEIPKGTRNKYEYDPELGGIKFDRLLMSAATYPADYGYLRGTLGEDGDPLDALVCLYEPTFPGCLIPVRPVGMFLMRDEETGSYWQQISGQAISGPLQGRQLTLVLSDELTFATWKAEEPQGTVLKNVAKYASEYEAKDWDAHMAQRATVIQFPEHGMQAHLRRQHGDLTAHEPT